MNISIRELEELGIEWEDICKVLGYTEYAKNEGQCDPDEPVHVTPDQFKRLKGEYVEEEVRYHIGDFFVIDQYLFGEEDEDRNDVYILSFIGKDEVCLISLLDGNRYTAPVSIDEDPYEDGISQETIDRMTPKAISVTKIPKEKAIERLQGSL